MKTIGADILEFFATWPPGDDVFHDDTPFSEDEHGVLRTVDEYGNPNGVAVEPGETYNFDYGTLGWQGKGAQLASFDEDFPRVYRKWLKARTTATFAVDVPKDQVDAFKALMKERGWKVTA